MQDGSGSVFAAVMDWLAETLLTDVQWTLTALSFILLPLMALGLWAATDVLKKSERVSVLVSARWSLKGLRCCVLRVVMWLRHLHTQHTLYCFCVSHIVFAWLRVCVCVCLCVFVCLGFRP